MRPRFSSARWIGLLLLLTALFYWKLGFSNRFTFLDSPDLTGQVIPWYEMQAKAWNQGVFPLWDPYVWSGQPVLGQMQPGGAFPLNWPLFAMPLGDDGHIRFRYLHVQRLFMHLLAALFAYALAKELEFSDIAAVLAGLAFTCGGWVGSVVWPQMLNGAIWLPLTLALFHRAARQTSFSRGAAWAVLCGGSVGMSLLSGHHQAPFFSLLALGGVFLYLFVERFREYRERAFSLAALFAIVGVAAFLVSALQLLPAFEYGGQALRWVSAENPVGRGDRVPYYVHHALRMELVTLLGLVTPRLHMHVNTFVGWTALVLALYAVATCWKERWVKAYGLLAILALSYASGTYSLLQGWTYEFIPEAHTARTSGYAIFVTQAAIFVLAARGLDALMRQPAAELRASVWIRRGQILLVAYAAMAYVVLFVRAMWGHMDPDPADNVVLSAVVALLLAACLQAYKQGVMTARVFAAAAVALLMTETYGTQFYDITDLQDPIRTKHINRLETEFDAPMRFLVERAQAGERFRYAMHPDLNGTNLGSRYGLEQAGGFLASVNRDYFEMFVALGLDEFYDLSNTKYFLSRVPQAPDHIERYAAPNGIKVYENPDVRPRAWLTYSNEWIRGSTREDDVIERVAECPESGRAQLASWGIQRVTLDVATGCDAYVVLADPFFKGWRAWRDGQETPIRRFRGGLRAVFVPAGQATVEFRYEPLSVAWGAWLTGAGFILCGLAAVWIRRRPAA